MDNSNYSPAGALGFLGTAEEDARNASTKAAAYQAYQSGAAMTQQQINLLNVAPVSAAQQQQGQVLVAYEAAHTNDAPSGITQQNWDDWSALWNATRPSVQLSSQNAGNYNGLSENKIAFANNIPWTEKVLVPHWTTAQNWCLPAGTVGILNRGNPRSLYDPIEYLRSALIDSDWDRVYYWFLKNYSDTYAVTGNSKNAFFPYADMNIFDYKYVIDDNGRKIYYPLSTYDLQQFLKRIVANFTIADVQHSSGHCAIGLIQWHGIPPYVVDLSSLGDNKFSWWMAIYDGLNTPDQGGSSVFQYESLHDLVLNAQGQQSPYNQYKKAGFSPCGDLRVGWVQGPKGEWTASKIITYVLIIAATYGVSLLSTPAVAAAEAGTVAATEVGTAGAAGAVTGAAATTAGSAAAASALEEVVITGTISTGVGAAASAAIIAAAAPAVALATSSGSLAPQSSLTNNVNAPPSSLDEVVISGHLPESTVVSTATGAIVATAAVPVISAAQNAPAQLDEVVVTGHTPVSSTLTSGNVVASASVPVVSETAAQSSQVSTDSQNTQDANSDQSSKTDWQSTLKALVKKYGLAYVQKYLKSLMTRKLGRQPTAQELDYANEYISSGAASETSNAGWIIAALGILAAIAGS